MTNINNAKARPMLIFMNVLTPLSSIAALQFGRES